MARMFGTDGVRGVAGSELTIELATKLGQAGAYVLTKEQEHQATIIVGCDTRISGGMLASALMAGICSVGANAIFVVHLEKRAPEKAPTHINPACPRLSSPRIPTVRFKETAMIT